MIPDKIKLEILTPHSTVYSGEVASVQLPGSEGYFGVFPGHTPFITTLKIGFIKINRDKSTDYFSTSGGIAEVMPDAVSVLAETAESAAEIDVERAAAAKARAEKKLHGELQKWDVERAQISLHRAVNRLKVSSA
jgi:F-type H+-transporting ATPase subunit epsilon